MPKPRTASPRDKEEIAAALAKRFNVKAKFEVKAAGPFRFAGNDEFMYIERSDLGSVAFSDTRYGTGDKALDPEAVRREVLLPRIEESLRRSGFDIGGHRFASFQDEFSGAIPTTYDKKDLDPRKISKHVARTAAFERDLDGVPVFGSELVIGLDPEGNVGRFRIHWPRLDPQLVEQARRLQAEVKEKKWRVPEALADKDTEILEIAAGVGHSAFAEPAFRSAAVVRVTYRRVARGTEYPIASTAYKYFDPARREVQFDAFPRLPGTTASRKTK
jgi:hypothetical protein